MRWKLLLLLPALGGCLAPASDIQLPAPGASPAPVAVASVPPASPVAVAAFEESSPADPATVGGDGEVLFDSQTNSDPKLENVAISLSLLNGEEMAGLDLADIHEEELPDPETLADNLLLSGAVEDPPEDEGETVAAADDISFDFPMVENEKVHYYINFFTGTARQTFTRWLERSGRYLPLMQEVFAEEGLPLDLAYLAMVESGFNNRAYSWAHAAGPWQFIASTGRLYGMDADWWLDERRDFEKATRAAARFLKDLHAKFGDWYLAVAAYNAGPGKIQRAIEMYETRDFWQISRGSYLATETKHYVPKLLAMLLIAKQPEKYGFTDLQYLEPVAFDLVRIPTATDLEIVAKYCEVSYEEIKDLNPELKRWCTPPALRDYQLRIPAGKKEQFEQQFSLLPAERRANYQRHKVQRGDSLNALARRYKIRVEDIMSLNRITNPRALRVGADLILPLRKGLSALPLRELGDDPRGGKSKARKTTYKVRKGDSLWAIAKKFGVSEKEIRGWNRMGKNSALRSGQVLNIAATTRPAAGAQASRSEKGSKTTYQVRSGDTLWKIARQFGVSEDDLREWNQLSRNQVLKPGQKLAIRSGTNAAAPAKTPADAKAKANVRKIVYRVRPGDTLWDISRKFAVDTRDILGWNNLKKSHVLQPGDELTLMVEEG